VPRAERIARLNDELRKTGRGGRIVVTQGVRSLSGFNVAELLTALTECSDFDADNDPHGERDMSSVDHAGVELLWKIDYYDMSLTWGSDNPADPSVTERVLTVFLPEEC
jgi:hypothetical protein